MAQQRQRYRSPAGRRCETYILFLPPPSPSPSSTKQNMVGSDIMFTVTVFNN
ncbi:hypothetical protein A2U01_0082042, partial [Trifolium medium]|nr:hypothetical protein [Trifolium medium]